MNEKKLSKHTREEGEAPVETPEVRCQCGKVVGELKRMWINQPSTLQKYYKLHGTNVLAGKSCVEGLARVFFLSGPVISMEISTLALSEGWVLGQDK